MTDHQRLLNRVERDCALESYNYKEIDGTYNDYLEIMIQIGYVNLFSVSFPLAPLLAFINNILELKVDQAKIMYFTRRPTPQGAQNIGIWKQILQALTLLSIFTTVGIITITNEDISSNQSIILIYFFYFSAAGIALKILISCIIPDTPRKFETVLKRHQMVVTKFLQNAPITVSDEVGIDRELVTLSVVVPPRILNTHVTQVGETKQIGGDGFVDQNMTEVALKKPISDEWNVNRYESETSVAKKSSY